MNKLGRSKNLGQGRDLKISKSQIRHSIKKVGSLFSAMFPLLKAAASVLGKTLGLVALGGLASEGARSRSPSPGASISHINPRRQPLPVSFYF